MMLHKMETVDKANKLQAAMMKLRDETGHATATDRSIRGAINEFISTASTATKAKLFDIIMDADLPIKDDIAA
jgi:hypothetical protein